MSKADEQIVKISMEREQKVRAERKAGTPPTVTANIDCPGKNEATGNWQKPIPGYKAKELAEASWRELRDCLLEGESASYASYAVDKIAFLSCCSIPSPTAFDVREGPNAGIISRSMDAGAILGITQVASCPTGLKFTLTF